MIALVCEEAAEERCEATKARQGRRRKERKNLLLLSELLRHTGNDVAAHFPFGLLVQMASAVAPAAEAAAAAAGSSSGFSRKPLRRSRITNALAEKVPLTPTISLFRPLAGRCLPARFHMNAERKGKTKLIPRAVGVQEVERPACLLACLPACLSGGRSLGRSAACSLACLEAGRRKPCDQASGGNRRSVSARRT